jgi:hypothetical protein
MQSSAHEGEETQAWDPWSRVADIIMDEPLCWPVLVAPVAEALAWVGLGPGRTRQRSGGRFAGRGSGGCQCSAGGR